MDLVWHGTASVEMRCDKGRILFDPFIPLKGADKRVGIEEYDGIRDIFVTHGHFDHISDLPEIAGRNPDVCIYCTRAPYRTLLKKGVPVKNLRTISFGEVLHAAGFTIRVLQGKHAILPWRSPRRWSYVLRSGHRDNLPHILRENLVCREMGETVFYRIEEDGAVVDLMGSLNLREDMHYPAGADLLILPYNGWEDNYRPAVQVIERLQPKKILLDHYDDTFPPLTMPLDLDPILNRYGKRIRAAAYGMVVHLEGSSSAGRNREMPAEDMPC